jgi:hypothetical protein
MLAALKAAHELLKPGSELALPPMAGTASGDKAIQAPLGIFHP